MSWVFRTAYAAVCITAVVWLLRGGWPLGAVVLVPVAVWLRHVVESGRAARFVRGFANPS